MRQRLGVSWKQFVILPQLLLVTGGMKWKWESWVVGTSSYLWRCEALTMMAWATAKWSIAKRLIDAWGRTLQRVNAGYRIPFDCREWQCWALRNHFCTSLPIPMKCFGTYFYLIFSWLQFHHVAFTSALYQKLTAYFMYFFDTHSSAPPNQTLPNLTLAWRMCLFFCVIPTLLCGDSGRKTGFADVVRSG